MAHDRGELDLQAKVSIRLKDIPPPREWSAPEGYEPGQPYRLETTLGRALFNETLPDDFPFVNDEIGKKQLSAIVNELAETYPKVTVANALDALKSTGFHWATRSGVTIAIADVISPPNKQEILGGYEQRAEKVQREFNRGLITDDERKQELIEIWNKATADVAVDMEKAFPKDNPIWMMIQSGARQPAAAPPDRRHARPGLQPEGRDHPGPIKSAFREGLSVVEYFISTHGARKASPTPRCAPPTRVT